LPSGNDVLDRRVDVLRQCRQGAAEIVGDRQHVAGEALDAELAFLLDVLLRTPTHVLRLGDRAQMFILQLGIFRLQPFHDPLERLHGGLGAVERHVSRGAARG